MKFLTLMEIEVKKMIPILFQFFVCLTVVSIILFHSSISELNKQVMRELVGLSVAEYVELMGPVTLTEVFDGWWGMGRHTFSFLFLAFVLMCSTFYLWYKEWFGQAKRIYLLLSLKGNRFQIFLSKMFVMMLAMMLFYGMVLINLWIGALLLNQIMPDGVVASNLISELLTQSNDIVFILPTSFSSFAYLTVLSILVFSGLSVFVLSERSDRGWGAVYGICYLVTLINLFSWTQSLFLFSDERTCVNWGFAIGVTVLNLGIGYWLLNKKVSV